MKLLQERLKAMTTEEGQIKLLEKNLEAHRKSKRLLKSMWILMPIIAILCFLVVFQLAIFITGSLLLMCTALQLWHTSLDKSMERRLKHIKQSKRKRASS